MDNTKDKISNKRSKRLIVVYTSKDYLGGYDEEGPLNILLAEKELVVKAGLRHKGDKIEMAKSLGITVRNLYDRITSHSLSDLF